MNLSGKKNTYKCYLCGKENQKIMFKDGIYKLCRCNSCSFVEVFPKLPPNEIIKIYSEEYFCSKNAKNYGYLNYLEEGENYLLTFRNRLRLLERLIRLNKDKKALEVGFAYGFFLLACEERGFSNLTGIEVAKVGWEYGKNHLKHSDLILGQIEDIKKEKFDYIFLWDIIEHIYDPKKTIKKCYELLNDGGYLIIETQNVNSVVAKLLGRKWWHYKHREHLYHFNKKTIEILLENSNFKRTKITSKTAGKYISKAFIVERLNRLHPVLSKLFEHIPSPKRVYVNFYDEMIAIFEKEVN